MSDDEQLASYPAVPELAAPEPAVLSLPGATARTAMAMAVGDFVTQGKATAYDAEVARELAFVLSGGNTDVTAEVTEKKLLELERQAFINLVKKGPTLDRIEHMLETGRPLRN